MVEPASDSDGPAIVQLTVAASTFNPIEVRCVDELWSAYQKQGSASGYEFLVYRDEGTDDGKVAGYACFGPHPLTEGTYDLYWIAVDPACQGRGIGRALLARVEEEVRKRGSRLLVIETSATPLYAAARRLYESAGYTREAVVHDFYAPGDDMVIYSKHLAAQPMPEPMLAA